MPQMGVYMCGISGVALKSGNAVKEVYGGLQRLEYRGYDSAGIAALCPCDGKPQLTVVKRKGRVAELETGITDLTATVAIGHTRWATHGAPCERNAHPHTCGKFAIVHNGIIENYRDLKTQLEGQGHAFSSDTDSEVIAVLISRYYENGGKGVNGILTAVASAVKRLVGSYAIAVLCTDFDGIIAVKHKSNAVVGYFEGGVCLSSDIPALPSAVTEATVLEDGDIALIYAGNAEFYDLTLRRVERVKRHISPMQLSLGKGDYPHYMLKEIREEERTVTDTAEGFFRTDLAELRAYLTQADKVILTGCGTAYNAALAAVQFFAERSNLFCVAEIASELRYKPIRATKNTLLIVVTQSGETADTVGVAEEYKRLGARVVAVTNCGYSAVTLVADMVIPVCAGPEICVAATKSYVGQLASLYLIAALATEGDGVQSAKLAKRELLSVAALFSKVHEGDLSAKLAKECAESSAVFFLGRGLDYAAAVEASLKLKEVSYVFSDSYPAGELKHGTLALIDEKTLSVVIVGDDGFADKTESTIEQIISRGGKAAVITCSQAVEKRLSGRVKVWLLPECPNLSIMPLAAALQLVAYRTAVLLNRNPDKPRNLAKSVTVE